MGDMKCDRDGCENITCERWNELYGYICWDCYSELEKYIENNSRWKTQGHLISEFMRSHKMPDIDTSTLDEIFPKIIMKGYFSEKTCIKCGGRLQLECDAICVSCLNKQGVKHEL